MFIMQVNFFIKTWAIKKYINNFFILKIYIFYS